MMPHAFMYRKANPQCRRCYLNRGEMARTALFLLAVLIATLACRPTPSDPVEYLHSEDSIIIQMLTVDKDTAGFERGLAVPEFTLYGNGTLIYQNETTDGTRLLQTLLPGDAVKDLLEDIVDEGFLNFSYEQPAPNKASGETTFFYAHTLRLANAVSVQGVSAPLPEDTGSEFDQYRDVQEFIEMLRALDPVKLGGTEPVTYVAKDYVVITQTADGILTELVVRSDEIAELLAGIGITLDMAPEELALPIRMDPGFGPAIRLAPLLLFHENFPEFDLQ